MGMFTEILLGMRQGAADRSASEHMQRVGAAVLATGKKGSVTLKMTIGMMKGGETETTIDIDITSKLPSEGVPTGIYYLDEEGKFHRADPRQLKMELEKQKAEDAKEGQSRLSIIPRHEQL